jgi:hypothetical protein
MTEMFLLDSPGWRGMSADQAQRRIFLDFHGRPIGEGLARHVQSLLALAQAEVPPATVVTDQAYLRQLLANLPYFCPKSLNQCVYTFMEKLAGLEPALLTRLDPPTRTMLVKLIRTVLNAQTDPGTYEYRFLAAFRDQLYPPKPRSQASFAACMRLLMGGILQK